MKLYSYVSRHRQVHERVKIFPLEAFGGTGSPNVYLGPPNISKTPTARKLKLKTQLDVVKYSLPVQKFFR